MELFLWGKYRTLVVKLCGDLYHHAAEEISMGVDRELMKTGAVNVAFDFSSVAFMDSSGIGVIMGRCKKARSLGGKVIIYGASDAVTRIIKMSGIDSIVAVADTIEHGIKEAALNV